MPEVNEDYPALPKLLRRKPERERHTDPLQQVPPAVIEKPVERIVEVEKIVEKPVERIVERVIEKPVEVEKVVERIIEKPVEKIVYVDRPAQQPTPPPERIIEKTYVYIPPEQRTESEVQPDRTAPQVEVKTETEVQETPEVETQENQPKNQRKIKASLIFPGPKAAPTRELPKFYKKPGRQRTEAKTKDVIVYRLLRKQWPAGLSEYMCWYYNEHYIKKGGKYYGSKTRQWRTEIKETA